MNLHFCRPCVEHEIDPHSCDGICKNDECGKECECGAPHEP